MILVDDVKTILASAIRLSIPLLFAACGEYVAERAGTLNISVEAMMLMGAFSGSVAAAQTGSTELGLLVGALCGLLIALAHANMSHRLAANTFVVGLTLNILVLGLTSYLAQSRSFQELLIGPLSIPGLSLIPIVGGPFFDQPWPAYIMYGLIPATWYLVQRTRWGLEVRAVGENPQAADASGIQVNLRRRQALLLSGLLSGLGGAYLAIAAVGAFNPGMTAGRGYIVIAAVFFGGWTLRGTILGCMLFGLAQALQLALPALGYTLNPEILISMPYILALVAMMFFAKRHRQPAALAQAFERGII